MVVYWCTPHIAWHHPTKPPPPSLEEHIACYHSNSTVTLLCCLGNRLNRWSCQQWFRMSWTLIMKVGRIRQKRGGGILEFSCHANLKQELRLQQSNEYLQKETSQLGLGCLQDKFQVAPLPSQLVLAHPHPYKGMHCSLGEGLGEFPAPASPYWVVFSMFWGFLRWRSWQISWIMSNYMFTTFCQYCFPSI